MSTGKVSTGTDTKQRSTQNSREATPQQYLLEPREEIDMATDGHCTHAYLPQETIIRTDPNSSCNSTYVSSHRKKVRQQKKNKIVSINFLRKKREE